MALACKFFKQGTEIEAFFIFFIGKKKMLAFFVLLLQSFVHER